MKESHVAYVHDLKDVVLRAGQIDLTFDRIDSIVWSLFEKF